MVYGMQMILFLLKTHTGKTGGGPGSGLLVMLKDPSTEEVAVDSLM